MSIDHLRSREPAVLGAFALVLLTVPAHLWAAGADLPLGGPNVYVGGLAVLAAMVSVVLSFVHNGRLKAVTDDFLPVFPVLAIGSLLTAWACFVYLATDTLLPRRVGQMILGLGVLFTVFCCVTTARRAYSVVLVIVLATFVSAVFGFAIAFYGDPFLTIWLRVADNVVVKSLYDVLTFKRLAGLGPDPIAFSYQLAIAVPLALALLLYGWPENLRWRRTLDTLTGVALIVMVTAVIANSSRSMLLGVCIAAVVVSVMYVRARRPLHRLVVTWCLIAAWITVFFNPTLEVDKAVFPDKPHIAVSDRSVLLDAPRGSFEWKLNRAYEALLLADPGLELNSRMWTLIDSSSRPRPYMVTTALRYALEHPFGTGTYYPSERHLDSGLDERTKYRVLTAGPHNQFLIILVYYGLPGVILLIAFYWQMVRPLWPAFLSALGQGMDQPAFLAPAVIGGMISYTFNSLLHNNGPFVGDWYHFILIGLVFALPRVLRTGQVTRLRTP